MKSKFSAFQILRNLARVEQKLNRISTGNRRFWVFISFICAKMLYPAIYSEEPSPGHFILPLAQAPNKFLYFGKRKTEKK